MDIYNFISFCGMLLLLLFAWCFSSDRKKMNWSLICWGIVIQLAMALFIFIVPAGSKFFLFLNDIVIKILNSSTAGAHFLFGRLALGPGQVNASGETSLGFILAFQAFPTIIFFSSLISILYFFNIMPIIIRGFAYVFTKLMKISGAESLSAASNIFVGIESALTIKPHLNEMTASELCTVLTVGMATVASNVLVLYVLFLQDQFPSIAAHLISASFLSAPAALVMSKILLPECEVPKTLGENIKPHYEKDNSLFEAIINGANSGVKMIVGISALLIAVLGLVALVDLGLAFIGSKICVIVGSEIDFSLKSIFGYIFYPFTLAIGIPAADAGIISKIIGERVVVTEVVAYQDLARVMGENISSSPRSFVLASYALCGFAHLPSMAIFVGGISALAPSRTSVIASVALRALIAATLGCLMTAAVAGIFFTQGSLLL
ncbi:MAG: nucleoside transporter [Candidatus Omnitrophica bacterium]|nr:nucleoside transporter [Candidatus Omnitrophota bacterium]MBU1997531.1 nucleoside transporter [Candidatus Omnitrophota bacterium]